MIDGETPCAFIELKDLLFIFGPIKKTSTGKIQKAQLRNQAIEFIKTRSLS